MKQESLVINNKNNKKQEWKQSKNVQKHVKIMQIENWSKEGQPGSTELPSQKTWKKRAWRDPDPTKTCGSPLNETTPYGFCIKAQKIIFPSFFFSLPAHSFSTSSLSLWTKTHKIIWVHREPRNRLNPAVTPPYFPDSGDGIFINPSKTSYVSKFRRNPKSSRIQTKPKSDLLNMFPASNLPRTSLFSTNPNNPKTFETLNLRHIHLYHNSRISLKF